MDFLKDRIGCVISDCMLVGGRCDSGCCAPIVCCAFRYIHSCKACSSSQAFAVAAEGPFSGKRFKALWCGSLVAVTALARSRASANALLTLHARCSSVMNFTPNVSYVRCSLLPSRMKFSTERCRAFTCVRAHGMITLCQSVLVCVFCRAMPLLAHVTSTCLASLSHGPFSHRMHFLSLDEDSEQSYLSPNRYHLRPPRRQPFHNSNRSA
jgi:hypothetical protein